MDSMLQPLVSADGSHVSRRVFRDPSIYRLEQQRIFARSWLYVAHESQLPRPGDFLANSMGETPLLDPALRETEALLNLQQETGSGLAPPLRDDSKLTLGIRVMRAYKMNSWSDNPPARTRRFVSNIEAYVVDGGFEVCSNLLLYYSRYGKDNHLYSGRRHDRLRETADGLQIAAREVLLDTNVVTGPSVGLFF